MSCIESIGEVPSFQGKLILRKHIIWDIAKLLIKQESDYFRGILYEGSIVLCVEQCAHMHKQFVLHLVFFYI